MNKELCYQLTARIDQLITVNVIPAIPASAKIAVDKIMSADPDKGRVLLLRPNFDLNTESQ